MFPEHRTRSVRKGKRRAGHGQGNRGLQVVAQPGRADGDLAQWLKRLFMFFHLVQRTSEDASRALLCEEQTMREHQPVHSVPKALPRHCPGTGMCGLRVPVMLQLLARRVALVSRARREPQPWAKVCDLLLVPGSRKKKATPRLSSLSSPSMLCH